MSAEPKDADTILASMTAEPEPSKEQPAPAEQPAKTETPEPQPETPTQPEPKTDAEKWRDYLSQFPDAETARKAVRAKAYETGWAVGSGYRAVNQIKKFRDSAAAQKARVPTFKIARANPEPLTTDENDEETEPKPQENQTQNKDETAQTNQYTPPPAPFLDTKEELKPILTRSAGNVLNNVLEIVAGKTGILGEGESGFLTHQEEADLATLLPYIIQKVTNEQLTESQYIDATLGLYAGSLATKAIKNRLANKAKEPPKQRETPPPPQSTPPAATPEPTISQEMEAKDTKVSWAKELPR